MAGTSVRCSSGSPFRKGQRFREQRAETFDFFLSVKIVFNTAAFNSSGVFLMKTGKSLYVTRLHERLQEKHPDCTKLLKTIRLIEPEVDEDKVLKSLLPFVKREHQTKPMIFHFDITSSVSTSLPQLPCPRSSCVVLAEAVSQ